jgi:hypothetical protein
VIIDIKEYGGGEQEVKEKDKGDRQEEGKGKDNNIYVRPCLPTTILEFILWLFSGHIYVRPCLPTTIMPP